MPYLDPQEAFEHFSGKVVDSIKQHFPVKGRLQTLHLDNLEVRDQLHPDDVRSQQKAKTEGSTWAAPIYGTFSLRDNETGKVIEKRTVRVADIPKMTKRYSYIVGGQEYQVDSQWQLKPGAYARRRQSGELSVQFNCTGPGSKSFHMLFDPEKKQFAIEWNKANIPAYPVLSTMGVTDEQLQKIWGKDILEANKKARGVDGALAKAFRSDKGRNPKDEEEAKEHMWTAMSNSKMRADATKLTLGKAHTQVTGPALLTASERILGMHQGKPEDNRDSLVFKHLRNIGEFAQDKINGQAWQIKQKMLRQVDSATTIRDIVKAEHFNAPVVQAFHKNQAARVASQINPLEMVSSVMQTTVRGPGGIQAEHGIVDETKYINPSHFGFLDPINTPEGPSTGVTLRLPLGVKRIGDEPHIPLYNLRTDKMEYVAPAKVYESTLLFPDQVTWKNGKPQPTGSKLKMLGKGNELEIGGFGKADYVMRHSTQVFNVTSNLIPFLHSTQGNRAGMASRHLEQAISLEHREAPLVQVSTGAETGHASFERMVGHQTSHTSPVAGTVTKVGRGQIMVQDASGAKHEVQLYDHYPLNDPKSVLHSTPTVQVGDKVSRGQHVADTNYTRNGTLALGTNLHVAYLSWKGYNFEDGIVVSESAANKMASVHLTKPSLQIDEKMVLDPRKFKTLHCGTFTTEQMDKIGDNGIVRVGQKVRPGDPLIVATTPFQLKDRTGIAAIRKTLSGVHTDRSMRWDSDFEGEVVAVHHKGDEIQVHVKTVEPVQVGDKMAGRHGNKGIVCRVLADKDMPHTKDGKHVEVLLNPVGVPSRINVGQIFETVAGKVAQKTGKPYIVKNFDPGVDQIAAIKREAAQHHISPTDELFDPETGMSVGQVQTGPLYMTKQVHQVEKKGSVRSGMTIPGSKPEHYDITLVPSGGGHTGGQSVGSLGMYALLAHGAKANIREMQTLKSEGPDPQTNESKRWRSLHNDAWRSIQMGTPMPPPQPTFAFQKFTDYLTAAGINMEKKGHQFVLSPLTDKQIEKMSSGALPYPDRKLSYKLNDKGEPLPMRGGLFDEKITGGHGGRNWSHIKLSEPIPNPVFETAIKSLTGLKQSQFDDIMAGRSAVTPRGDVTLNTKLGVVGGEAIKLMLQRIDVHKDLERARANLDSVPIAKVDPALKRVKYLEALRKTGMRPEEAYVLHNLPVIPPVMRPVSVLPNGSLNEADLNGLYSQFSELNKQLGDKTVREQLTDKKKEGLRESYYDGVRALMGVGIPYKDQKQKGLLHQISGSSPKYGYFQRTLMNRRQDLSMRSTIVPEPSLGLDEVGIPKQYAMDLFRPFVARKLVLMGAAPSTISGPTGKGAQELIAKGDPMAWKALEKVMEEKPVLLKRDPVLHKYGIQGFKPKLVAGSAIQIHPLVTSGYNADFDGNCYIGSTLLCVKFRHNVSDGTLTSLSESYAMKFSSSAKIVCRTSDGVVVEMPIRDFPKLPVLPRHDRNGAAVYRVPDGVSVWSYDHAKGISTFEPVSDLTVEQNCKTAKVRTRKGFEVGASTNESLCVYDHETEEVRESEPFKSLGRLVPISTKLPAIGTDGDFEFGWMLGAFTSDGFFCGDSVVGLSKVDSRHRQRFFDSLCRADGREVNRAVYSDVHTAGDGDAIEGHSVKEHYTDLSENTRNWFRECYLDTESEEDAGRAAYRKCLPVSMAQLSRTALLGVLTGLLDGDGTVTISRAKGKPQVLVAYSTSSRYLVQSIHSLCTLLGIRCRATVQHPKPGRLQRHDSWVVSFSTVDIQRISAELHTTYAKYREVFALLQGQKLKDDRDIVPVPDRLMCIAASKEGPCGSDQSLLRTLYTIKSSKPRPYLSRALAMRVLHLMEKAGTPGLAKWATLVNAVDMHWDVVETVDVAGSETVYDLVVPTTKVFVVNGGMVVWDTMSVYVPVSPEAENEARKMMPSNNLFSNATGKVMYQPKHESALGLYKLSRITGTTKHSYPNPGAAVAAVRDKKIEITDSVHVNGIGQTTAGRILLSASVPKPLQNKILTDHNLRLDSSGINSLLGDMAKLSENHPDHKGSYAVHVNQLKDLGNGMATGIVPILHRQGADTLDPTKSVSLSVPAHTLSLDDFTPDRHVRDHILSASQKKVDHIMHSDLAHGEKERRSIEEWHSANLAMQAVHNKKEAPRPNNLFMMQAIKRPSPDQYRQLVLAPMLVQDTSGRTIPIPITKSFSEGQDVSDYWIGMYGARRGTVRKVQEVQEPGVITKMMQNTTMDMLVTAPDCGTNKGIALSVNDKSVHDRHLAADFREGKLHIPAGTMLSPDVVSQIRSVKKDAQILVRSPLKCQHEHGICQKCMGLSGNGRAYAMGHNVGVESAHAHGEPSTQLMLSSFHTGGVASNTKTTGDQFEQFENLVRLPEHIPDEASLAMKTGTISAIRHDKLGAWVTIDEHEHFVGRDRFGNGLHEDVASAKQSPGYVPWQPPTVGMKVVAGQHLSDPNRTVVNPKMLYQATKNIDVVQNHLSSELHKIFGQQGVNRRQTEVLVKAMTDTTRVHSPGDHPDVLRGEYRNASWVKAQNAQLQSQGKRPIIHSPELKGIDVLPLHMREDWMAKLQHQHLRDTILDAAATGGVSDLHSTHPVPGLAYGAEFGVNKTVSLKPGMERFKNVPEHHY